MSKSISELTKIFSEKLGKTIHVIEINSSALLPGAIVTILVIEISSHKISFVGKKTMQAFHRNQIWPNPSTGRSLNYSPKNKSIEMAKTIGKLEKIRAGSNQKRSKTTHATCCVKYIYKWALISRQRGVERIKCLVR